MKEAELFRQYAQEAARSSSNATTSEQFCTTTIGRQRLH